MHFTCTYWPQLPLPHEKISSASVRHFHAVHHSRIKRNYVSMTSRFTCDDNSVIASAGDHFEVDVRKSVAEIESCFRVTWYDVTVRRVASLSVFGCSPAYHIQLLFHRFWIYHKLFILPLLFAQLSAKLCICWYALFLLFFGDLSFDLSSFAF